MKNRVIEYEKLKLSLEEGLKEYTKYIMSDPPINLVEMFLHDSISYYLKVLRDNSRISDVKNMELNVWIIKIETEDPMSLHIVSTISYEKKLILNNFSIVCEGSYCREIYGFK